MKVKNMLGPHGNPIPNQFTIEHRGFEYFQSYDSIISRRKDGKVVLDEKYWDYSRITGKYRNQFLGECLADTRAKIASGEYTLANLN